MVESGSMMQEAAAREIVHAESMQVEEAEAEQESEAHAELIDFLLAELEADYSCPLTLVCSCFSLCVHHTAQHASSRHCSLK